VTIGAASGIEGRVAFNRRFVMRDGTAVTHPWTGSPEIRYAEGPIDPEVGVLCLRNSEEKVIAAMLHFTSHPNHGYPQNYISADWPGAWSDGVREIFGEQCVPLVLNGCCGNIHHTNHLDPHHVEGHHMMGEKLTETTREIVTRIEFDEAGVLDWRSEIFPIPWRDIEPSVFEEARLLLKKIPRRSGWTKHALASRGIGCMRFHWSIWKSKCGTRRTSNMKSRGFASARQQLSRCRASRLWKDSCA